jgi:hypothetical protein
MSARRTVILTALALLAGPWASARADWWRGRYYYRRPNYRPAVRLYVGPGPLYPPPPVVVVGSAPVMVERPVVVVPPATVSPPPPVVVPPVQAGSVVNLPPQPIPVQ